MMALTMAFVGGRSETTDRQRHGAARNMSAIAPPLVHRSALLIAGPGWRAIFLVNLPLGILTLFSRYRALSSIAGGARPMAPASTDGHAAACCNARGLCSRH